MGRAFLLMRRGVPGRFAFVRAFVRAVGFAIATLACLNAPLAHAQGGPAARPAAASAAVADAHPSWSELNPVQQRILSPLINDWDTLSEIHRRKWLQIAVRYQHLQPAEQQKLQARMGEWVKLTPQQRRAARENYQITRSLPAEKRTEAWNTYQKLPEEQKEKLAAAEKVPSRPGAVSALPSGKRQPTQASRHLRPERKAAASQAAAVPPSAPHHAPDATRPPGQHDVTQEAAPAGAAAAGADTATRQ